MTAAQMQRLETIIAKIETLQRQVTDREDREALDAAKNRLMGRLK